MQSDQDLLKSYLAGCHNSFRELVERHANMIFGTAVRITADWSAAEEVVQDVFCLLARKSAALTGHPSVAGWLHRTTVNASRSRLRARTHYNRKLLQLASEPKVLTAPVCNAGPSEKIDLAINRLPMEERSAVVLRYYHEQEYAQISSQLGVSEAAVRKRVSRGLKRLHQLVGGDGAFTLVPGTLAILAPPGLVKSAAASGLSAVPVSGLLTKLFLMNTKQTAAVAAATLITGGLTWLGTDLWQENKDLKQKLGQIPPDVHESAIVNGGSKSAPPQNDPSNGDSGLNARIVELEAALDLERGKRLAAEQDAKTVRDQVAQLKDEVVVSFGKVTQIGETLGSVFNEALALVALEKSGKLNTPENEARFGKFLEKAGSISGISKEIIQFEDSPEEGSRFVASAYGAVFELDPAEQEKVAGFFAERLAEANKNRLTLANLPERGTPEFMPWLEKRWGFFEESRAQLRGLIPHDKQEIFDQSVEKGGYGFKNMTLKGMPLMFSLGGDPR